jgi:hypothetical protein
MTFSLNRQLMIDEAKGAFWRPAVVLVASIVAVVLTEESGWLGVGGAVIAALGARLWAARLFRYSPERVDDPLPPATDDGGQVNFDHFNQRLLRTVDNWSSYFGVWMTIAGGMLGSAGPFLWDQVLRLTTQSP